MLDAFMLIVGIGLIIIGYMMINSWFVIFGYIALATGIAVVYGSLRKGFKLKK